MAQRGNEGKWQTPHQRGNVEKRLEFGATIEAGDAGIWVTCQRGLEKKAMAEMTRMCEEVSPSCASTEFTRDLLTSPR